MTKREDLICGIWKFKDSVNTEELQNFAEELAKDEQYMHVYIRKVSKDQIGIGFTYKSDFAVGDKELAEFYDLVKDKIYRRFGTGLLGWDIANTREVFKGF